MTPADGPPDRQPVQLQTVHGQTLSRMGTVLWMLLVLLLVLEAGSSPTSRILGCAAWALAALLAIRRLRRKDRRDGLIIRSDGSFETEHEGWRRRSHRRPAGRARSVLRIRNDLGARHLELPAEPGFVPPKVSRFVRAGWPDPARLLVGRRPNHVLARAAGTAGPWRRTGIIWGKDDEAFFAELTTYLDGLSRAASPTRPQ